MQGAIRSANQASPVDGNAQSACALASVRRWLTTIKPGSRNQSAKSTPTSQDVPLTSQERLRESLADAPLQLDQLVRTASTNELNPDETVLYLGYGSNMSAETFRGRRNIKPLSQMNVLVPELSLTFDLPGIPYSEPCFGNVRYRQLPETHLANTHIPLPQSQMNSERLIGVVYEVTKADFAHIIATEGGGASYQDVLVNCYPLTEGPEAKVPSDPQGPTFKAHTLFSPKNVQRPDPSYAQPSARYLNLLKTGAKEHRLPYEYQDYLESLTPYRITTTKQRLGSFIFLAMWGPVFAFIFGGAGMFVGKDGKYPKWYQNFALATFAACWGSYDDFFKNMFGDGERTVENSTSSPAEGMEKEGLVRFHKRKYGSEQT